MTLEVIRSFYRSNFVFRLGSTDCQLSHDTHTREEAACDMRLQLRTEKSLRGNPLPPEQLEKLKTKEQHLLARQRAEQLRREEERQRATQQASRVNRQRAEGSWGGAGRVQGSGFRVEGWRTLPLNPPDKLAGQKQPV